MISLIARFTARPEHRERVAALITEYAQHVRAVPGTITFEPFTSRDEPDVFVVYEQYADEAAFQHHLGEEANAVFNGQLQPLITGAASELTFLEPAAAAGEPSRPRRP